MVWITCEGENPADKENIGPFRYIPQDGFMSQYFPFLNQDGYLSPLVAIYFEQPIRESVLLLPFTPSKSVVKYLNMARFHSLNSSVVRI